MTEMPRYTIVNVDENEMARHARTELLRDAGYRMLEALRRMDTFMLTVNRAMDAALPLIPCRQRFLHSPS